MTTTGDSAGRKGSRNVVLLVVIGLLAPVVVLVGVSVLGIVVGFFFGGR